MHVVLTADVNCTGICKCNHCWCLQVNDFAADAIVSQLLLLDSQDPKKVSRLIVGADIAN